MKVSVAEITKLTGKPKAEIYRLLKEDTYCKYVFIENGLKMVDTAFVDALNGVVKPEVTEEEKHSPKEEEKEDNADEIEMLKEIIKEKDRQIQELSLRLAEMAQKTQEITEKALNTVAQQQILAAMAQKKQIPWYKRLLPIGKHEID